MAFFQKVRFAFQISQSPKKIIPKNYPELEIWISCLLKWAGISNFKLRIVFWNIFFFGRLGDLKNKSHFLKKSTFKELPALGLVISSGYLLFCNYFSIIITVVIKIFYFNIFFFNVDFKIGIQKFNICQRAIWDRL